MSTGCSHKDPSGFTEQSGTAESAGEVKDFGRKAFETHGVRLPEKFSGLYYYVGKTPDNEIVELSLGLDCAAVPAFVQQSSLGQVKEYFHLKGDGLYDWALSRGWQPVAEGWSTVGMPLATKNAQWLERVTGSGADGVAGVQALVQNSAGSCRLYLVAN